ncbi:hypothetical protein EON67_01415 [archaeon]|nr:MAG: hypothetical protein EON67_01415 [archaeon]
MVAVGNHELWFDFAAYRARFSMPNMSVTQNLYYSLNIGPVHLAIYDTETAIDTADVNATQLAWLQADLAAANANRAVTPWVVAAGHRPLYCSNTAKMDCEVFASILRFQCESTFVSSHVDLVLGAHMHGYERAWPTIDGVPVSSNYTSPAAPVYVVNGAAGNREGNKLPKGAVWSAFQSNAVGYGYLQFAGAHSMTYSFIESATGNVLDTFTITK